MVALETHRFLREHRDEIVREWEALASGGACDIPLAGSALRGSLPELLDELARWMERDDPERTARLCATASVHAVQRLDHSFQLPQLLREYALLRGTILRSLLRQGTREQVPPQATAEEAASELARLNAGLDLAVSDAVSHFIDQRDRRVADLRRSQEEARRAAEVRYDKLVQLSPDAILVHRNDRIEFASPAAVELFGATSPQELLGKSPLDLVRLDDHPLVRERNRRLYAGDSTVARIQVTVVRLDGTTRLVEANATSFEDARGKAIEAILRDVTDRQRAEEALLANEQRLRAHFDNSPLAVIEFDPQLAVTRWSKEAERVFGWTAAEMIGRRVSEVRWIHEDDEEVVRRESARLLGGEGTRMVQAVRNYRRDGSIVHCEWYASALHDPQGRLVSILSHVLDVTDRKRAEEELRASEERFRTLADNIAQLAWMADEKGSLFWFNKRWFDFTGTTLDEVGGHGWRKVHHPDHVERVVEKLERRFEAGEPWEDSFPLRGRDGAYRWFLCRAFPIRDGRGRVARWFGTATDVTELREAQEALRVADRRKTEFLAILSHELRNCLAPIETGLHLLERAPPGSARSDRAREIIRRQVGHVASLVGDLLDMSRIEAGKIRIERTRVDAREIVRRACEDVRPAFEERGIALELDLDLDREPLWVDADEARLAQIVGNLLGNAMKFTPRSGSVHVTVARDEGAMELRVRDTGSGIEPRFLAKIFEPFTQAERTRGTAHGGMGIGLALVKSLVTMHGGDVRAHSEGRETGAEFIVSLPLVAPPEVREPRPKPVLAAAIPSLDILIVDDNRDGAETLEQLLQLEGHRTRLAFDGASATEAFRERAPDVFISDVGLPDVSGYDLMRAIRRLEAGPATFAVALTGYAQADDVERAREAGFDAHLSKPAPLQRLHELLAEAAARRAERETTSPPPPEGSARHDEAEAPRREPEGPKAPLGARGADPRG